MTATKPENLKTIQSESTLYCMAKGDTGATNHYWRSQDKNILKNRKKGPEIAVQLPDSNIITSSEIGDLPLSSSLSQKAKQAIVLPSLKSSNLLSLGQLCDDGCQIILDRKQMFAIKNKKVILKGLRNPKDGLYDIPISKTNITTGCCVTPRSVAVLQPKRNTSTNHKLRQSQQPKPERKLAHHLQSLCTVAEDNDFDNAIEKQLLKDKNKEQSFTSKLNVIIRKKQTHMDLIKYLHAACFSPVKSTFRNAIKKGFLKTWPGLTVDLVDKYLTPTIATEQGHLTQEKQHLQSTKKVQENLHPLDDLCNKTEALKINHTSTPIANDCDTNTSKIPFTSSTNDCCYAIISHKDNNIGYMDTTGRFPQRSSRGNEYILIGFHYNTNVILAEPIKNRSAQSLTTAWENMHKEFKKSTNAPNIYVLDNEKSTELIETFNKYDVTYQLAPPHNHRTNLAERAIQTFKHHFKAGLATCDPSFPLSEWDRLVPQAVITLNLLRSSRLHPNISAYTHLFGEFDFRATPLAPPGNKLVAHVKPSVRNSWDLNGVVGYYTGPAMQHYRCVTCYFPKTRSERICDTVRFIPHVIPIPQTSVSDHLRQASSDIIHLLNKPPSTTYPALEAGDPIRNALRELSTLLGHADNIKITEPSTLDRTLKNTLPSVKTYTTINEKVTRSPRVRDEGLRTNNRTDTTYNTSIGVDALTHNPSIPKNTRFRNNRPHSYNLRPRRHSANLTPLLDNINHYLNHIYNPDGKRLTMDALLKGPDNKIWSRSLSNEWGRLANGNKYGIRGTKTLRFISRKEIPKGCAVTYATFVCDYKPLKSETHRVRITVGGDKLTCLDDTGSPAANLLETKLLLNSTISDAKYGARMMCVDIVNFFLASPMNRNEYMRVPIRFIPEDIRQQYNIDNIVSDDGYVYVCIEKGMYGLKNAAILAYDNLKTQLKKYGYYPIEGTVGVWAHATRRTRFCVCVDDFAVKYFCMDDAQHFLKAISSYYAITVDWEARNYCGLELTWDYAKGIVDVAMPQYVAKALKRLNYTPSTFPQFSPHAPAPFTTPTKGKQQMAEALDTTPNLPLKEQRYLQSILGTLLYYGRALEYSILPAVNDVAREQSAPTISTLKKAKRILDYVATYPNAYLRYYASDMILNCDSDAAYLVVPQAKSRVAGFYHLSSEFAKNRPTPINGGVLVECKILRHVVASAAEAEVAGLFYNAQTVLHIRRILQALNHPQPPTPMKTDNSTANGFVHKNIQQKRSKSWDMRFYWLRDKLLQKQFQFFWRKGTDNNADYFTKHHPIKHHKEIRSRYVHDKNPTPTKINHLANQISILYKNLTSKCQLLDTW